MIKALAKRIRRSVLGKVLFLGCTAFAVGTAPAEIIDVPDDVPTIQGAIDAASNGDTVLVAPGTYYEALEISGKTITLASWYHTTGSEWYVGQTILDGSTFPTMGTPPIILVEDDVGEDTRIRGFTIQNGDDGISCEALIYIEHNRFYGNVDAIDYEGGGGVCAYNLFEQNRDDGIDLDHECEGVFEHNTIINNDDDGIEIRLHDDDIAYTLNVVIRENYISGNGEDGIQFIDSYELTPRSYRIERNMILNNVMAGIGCMGNENSTENYEAADILEPVHVINNTIAGNEYGLTGGDRFVVVNNILADTTFTALKRVDGASICSYNLLWGNGLDNDGSNIDTAHTLTQNPLLTAEYELTEGSPCVDAGTAYFEWMLEVVLDLPGSDYWGAAPDIGADEFVKDINDDGVWNAIDVQLTILAALDIPVGYNCDMNGDGVVNAVDVQRVIVAALA